MKITFEGQDIADIIDQVSVFIADVVLKVREYADDPEPVQKVKAPVDKSVNKPAGNPVENVWKALQELPAAEKPKRERTEKQRANDERLRVAALEKIAAKKAAKAVDKSVEKPVEKPVEKQPEPFADPAEIVRLREKTFEELREAYSNGHQQEVFELLSRFGNGAKSFRELPPEAFVPIREAIDKGALT